MARAASTLLVAIAAIAAAVPARAQPTDQAVLDQCAAEIGFTAAECACVLDTIRPDITERQYEYFVARVTRNDAEVQRMRTFMGLFERLAILFKVLNAAETCAPGKPFEMPES